MPWWSPMLVSFGGSLIWGLVFAVPLRLLTGGWTAAAVFAGSTAVLTGVAFMAAYIADRRSRANSSLEGTP